MESHTNCNRDRGKPGCAEPWMVHATADSGGSSEGDDKTCSLEYKLHRKKDNSTLQQLNPLLNIGNTFTKRRTVTSFKKEKERKSQPRNNICTNLSKETEHQRQPGQHA